jgi:hypothetical protein
LRRRWRKRIGDRSLDRTLRHPPCPERDGHSADATDPDLGRASDLAADRTQDLGRTPNTSLDPHAVGRGHAGGRRVPGVGTLGWTLLILLVVALAAGWLIWRSRRKSAWDAQAEALEANTRGATSTQLPAVLTAETAGQRALSWPPLRAALVDLIGRWDLLAERAPDDQRQNRVVQIRSLLQELLAAVDAENQALAAERDWRLLRPRVDQAGQALFAVLAGVGQQEPSAGAEPWQPTPGG